MVGIARLSFFEIGYIPIQHFINCIAFCFELFHVSQWEIFLVHTNVQIVISYDCCQKNLETPLNPLHCSSKLNGAGKICTDNRRLVQTAWRRNHDQAYVAACLLCVLSRRRRNKLSFLIRVNPCSSACPVKSLRIRACNVNLRPIIAFHI